MQPISNCQRAAWICTIIGCILISSCFMPHIIFNLTPTTVLNEEKTFNVLSSEGGEQRLCKSTERNSYVQQKCKDYVRDVPYIPNPTNIPIMYVDDTHRVIYCQTPKVGCSTFKLLLLSSSSQSQLSTIQASKFKLGSIHRPKFLESQGLRLLSSYSTEERHYRLKHYFKFTAVRHPFDRLFSYWRDKVVSKTFHGKSEIANGSQWNSFLSTLESILKGEILRRPSHYLPMHSLCHFCNVQYDSIVRLETSDEDLPLILSKLPDPNGQPYKLPHKHMKWTVPSTEKLHKLSNVFKDVNESLIDGLLDYYYWDFQLFGYHWNKETKRASCQYADVDFNINKTYPQCC